MELTKFIKISMLVLAAIFFVEGAYGVYTGISNVLSGGYADNIFLGAFMMLLFPLPCLFLYFYLRHLEKG